MRRGDRVSLSEQGKKARNDIDDDWIGVIEEFNERTQIALVRWPSSNGSLRIFSEPAVYLVKV